MSTLYSIGLMNQLGDALEAEGFTPDDVTKLRSHSKLDLLLSFAKGQAEIVTKAHTIDCDVSPHAPNKWTIIEHQKDGQLRWNSDEIELYLCEEQKDSSIEGNELRKKLERQSTLNACVLDYLLANPQLIPNKWKGKTVCFWGTIYYCVSDGHLYVRYLYWDDNKWQGFFLYLNNPWCDTLPAAIRK